MFGDSWRVLQGTSLFDYAPGTSTETFTDRTFPDKIVTTDDLSASQKAAANAACAAFGVRTADERERCELDVGVTGEPEFADSAADAQDGARGVPTDAGTLTPGEQERMTLAAGGTSAR